MKPKIILAITDKETNAQIKAAKVDVVELRVDLFRKLAPVYVRDQVLHRRKLKLPLLLTIRNQKKEGAAKDWSIEQKTKIFEAVLPFVDMVDIELSSPILKAIITSARKLNKVIIVSMHNFDHTPAHLENIFKKALSTRADIIKISAKANSLDDVFHMIEFTRRHRRHPLITLCMGPIGMISRLILPAMGSLYTYSFLSKPTAPGQIDVKTLNSHLKFYYP